MTRTPTAASCPLVSGTEKAKVVVCFRAGVSQIALDRAAREEGRPGGGAPRPGGGQALGWLQAPAQQ